MRKLENIEPKEVFKHFEDICAIPHGSGDMDKISNFCVDFAKENNLEYIKDAAQNVIIYKPATLGYEQSEPIILQGHLDMVCQADYEFDFLNNGLDLFLEGDLIGAKGTSLGADNGIGAAMIMAILKSDNIPHPPIEAVFTTDEEIGLIGASKLDFKSLKAKRMINLDSEEQDTVTVSCAGGSEVKLDLPLEREPKCGRAVTISLKNLKGGHSGVEIDKGRVNADTLMARVLAYLEARLDFSLISLKGGSKSNAIPSLSQASLVVSNEAEFKAEAEKYLSEIKAEIFAREEDFTFQIDIGKSGEYQALKKGDIKKLSHLISFTPNGICEMSAEIKGLAETSLNLGVLNAEGNEAVLIYALRSNKKSALEFLEFKLLNMANFIGAEYELSGRYMPWEYNKNSILRDIYAKAYNQNFGTDPKVEAVHAGLECSAFASNIKDIDCISVGPDIFDVHTSAERLSVKSTADVFRLLCKVLAECK